MENVPLKSIGIIFSDNDFSLAVLPFMRLLLPDGNEHYTLRKPAWTKAQVVELFNKLAYGLYLLKQNGWRYKIDSNLEEYLKIKEEHVLFNEEIGKYIEESGGNCNGEFFCVDFDRNYVWVM